MTALDKVFFHKDACELAVALLGKLICRTAGGLTLKARIIETEAYYISEKASHASLGYTHKRRALFMEAGTIYMYHARGKPSLNFSAEGEGNAVLIKSSVPVEGTETMLRLNPGADGTPRDILKLCSGQTLTAMSLGLKVDECDAKEQSRETLWTEDDGYGPERVIRTTRLGIPEGRDGHLPYRMIDYAFADRCTKNPLRSKTAGYDIIDYEKII